MERPYVDNLVNRRVKSVEGIFVAVGSLVLVLVVISALTGVYG